MSIRHNVIANTASQVFLTAIGIVMVPVYIRWMGAEAYGLVGFHAMLNGWFSMIDLGLTPMLSRQVARHRGGAVSALEIRQLVGSIERIFVAVAVVGGLGLVLASGFIVRHWIHAEALPPEQLAWSVRLMGLTIGVRFVTGLYVAVVTGSEQLVWLGTVLGGLALVKALGVLAVFEVVGATPVAFFAWQFALSGVEMIALAVKGRSLLPALGGRLTHSARPLRSMLRLSMSLAVTAAIWVAMTNLDKLLLSMQMPLSSYAGFTVAVLAAGSVHMIGIPLRGAVQPRLARLEAGGDRDGFLVLYGRLTQVLAATALPAGFVLAACAQPLLWAWTGDVALSREAAPVLATYAIGNAVLAVGAPTFVLQVAKGDVRLHLIGNVALLVLLVPAIAVGVRNWGAAGAGSAWLLLNVLYFVVWVPLIHARLLPGHHARWLAEDVLPCTLAAAAVAASAFAFRPAFSGRGVALAYVAGASITAVAACIAASPALRQAVREYVERVVTLRPAR